MVNPKGVFSQDNTPEGHTETFKSSFFPYKQVSGRNGDHGWLRMTNAFILCDLVWKVQKSHAVNREGSFIDNNGHKGVIMNCLTHWPTFCYYIISHELKMIDFNAVWDGNLEVISDFFCGSGHVIPKHEQGS